MGVKGDPNSKKGFELTFSSDGGGGVDQKLQRFQVEKERKRESERISEKMTLERR